MCFQINSSSFKCFFLVRKLEVLFRYLALGTYVSLYSIGDMIKTTPFQLLLHCLSYKFKVIAGLKIQFDLLHNTGPLLSSHKKCINFEAGKKGI